MNNSEKLTEEIERVLQSGGGSALFDREIMAVLLGAVHDRKQAQDVTKTLMDNCPGIGEILGREIDDLKMIEGMTEHAAAAIECVKEAYKRALRGGLKRGPVMDSQEKLIEYVRVNIGFSAKEAVQIIYLDKQNRLIRDEVYFGTIDEVHLSERKVVKKALSMEAASIILSHNHPGGSLEPSEDDKVMTRELVLACQGVGIELEDHIIMTDKGYCSFKERELL